MGSKKPDEIDFIDLLANFFIAIKRHLVLILLLTGAGVGLGLFLAKTSDDIYINKMLMSSDVLTYSYANQLIGTLNDLSRDGNAPALAQKLNLSAEQASSIVEIKVTAAIENQAIIPESERKYFVITVELKNQQKLDSLERGVVLFFENNHYMKARVSQRREGFTYLIDGIDKELVDLENLKKKIHTGELFEKSRGTMMLDPATLNSEIVKLKEARVKAEESLKLANSVQVIEGFTPLKNPAKSHKMMFVILGALMGVIVAFFIIGLISMARIVKEKESLHP